MYSPFIALFTVGNVELSARGSESSMELVESFEIAPKFKILWLEFHTALRETNSVVVLAVHQTMASKELLLSAMRLGLITA